MHVDNWNPDTYLWILEECDVPFVPKEWNGILKDLYYNRWRLFFDCINKGGDTENFDWFSIDEDWVKNKKTYPNKPYNNVIDIAKDILLLIND